MQITNRIQVVVNVYRYNFICHLLFFTPPIDAKYSHARKLPCTDIIVMPCHFKEGNENEVNFSFDRI